MKQLSQILEDAGCKDVKTYIQSGNAVFNARVESADSFAADMGDQIEDSCGFRPAIYLLRAKELQKIIASNPYPKAVSEPKSLHVFFLEKKPPKARIEEAQRLTSRTESVKIVGRTLFLRAPEGIGRSKFVKEIDRALDMNTTSRNWRTITKLSELVSSIE